MLRFFPTVFGTAVVYQKRFKQDGVLLKYIILTYINVNAHAQEVVMGNSCTISYKFNEKLCK